MSARNFLAALLFPCLLLFSGYNAFSSSSEVKKENFRSLSYQLTTFSEDKAHPKKRFPMVLVLHGHGEPAERYLQLWKAVADQRRIMIVAPTRTRAYDNVPGDLDEFYQLVEDIAQRYPVDREKIFLAGASAGSLIARWLAVNRPTFWKGLILIASPGGESWPNQVSKDTFPAVLFLHGEKDNQFAVEDIRQLVMNLKEKGVNTKLITDPNEGHIYSPRWNDALFDWISERTQIKKQANKNIGIEATGYR